MFWFGCTIVQETSDNTSKQERARDTCLQALASIELVMRWPICDFLPVCMSFCLLFPGVLEPRLFLLPASCRHMSYVYV